MYVPILMLQCFAIIPSFTGVDQIRACNDISTVATQLHFSMHQTLPCCISRDSAGMIDMQGGGFSWLFPFENGAPPIGWHDAVCYLVLPVALVVSQFITQKILQPPNQDESAQQTNAILKFLPLMIGETLHCSNMHAVLQAM